VRQQQQQVGHCGGSDVTVLDYWKLLTVLQASDVIMWSLQVAGDR
jgi:hypothetical protein